MANTNLPKSFEIQDKGKQETPMDWVCAASYAGKHGDVVYLDSNGRTTATEGVVLGIQDGGITSVATGLVETTASATAGASKIKVFTNPGIIFKGQISSWALTEPYTTRSEAACYDIAGSAGAQYVNKSATGNDTIKVIQISTEYDTGKESEVGSYAKCLFQFNQYAHYRGVIA